MHFDQRRLLISGQILRQKVQEVCLTAIHEKCRVGLSQFLSHSSVEAGDSWTAGDAGENGWLLDELVEAVGYKSASKPGKSFLALPQPLP